MRLWNIIYIPIWLDLLYLCKHYLFARMKYLHSNMVRFIIISYLSTSCFIIHIYIPIWLDLLLIDNRGPIKNNFYLHSNMVRFIMIEQRQIEVLRNIFTFQYG